MTSLRQHIDAHTENFLNATLRAYHAALASVGKNADRAVPGLESQLGDNLDRLREQLLAHPMPATLLRTQQSVESELTLWADGVERHLKSKAGEAREIILAVASAAQSLASRDKQYAHRFRALTSRLQEIGDLNDLSEIRKLLLKSSTDLGADVRNMESEGQQTIAGLEVRLESYRKQLAEAENRECQDVLTGLINRRGIEVAIERRREQGVAFCIVLLDLNSFKPVNDKYGHAAGDDLLKQFSIELRSHFRPADLIGRWGGDEFIVVAAGDLANAENCVARVRKWAFGTYKIQTPKGVVTLPLSAAAGITAWDLQEGMQQLIARADESMYQDKRAVARPFGS